MKVVLLPQAAQDLDGIADPLYTELDHRLATLGEFPEIGAPMTGPLAGYRSTVVGFFRIIYRLLPRDVIEVAYVRDCRRRPLP